MFDRIKPCKTCPFRTNDDGLRFLGATRAEEISNALIHGDYFTCHDDIDKPKRKRQHCVGAMLILEKQNKPNQMMRLAERINLYDRHKLVGDDEVFDDFESWIDSQSKRQ